jgi:PEP-CTERM motif
MKSTTKKLQRLSAIATLTIGTLLTAASSAQAASFTTNFEQKNGTGGDTTLKSITQNGKTVSNFSYVKSANILENTVINTQPGMAKVSKINPNVQLVASASPTEVWEFNRTHGNAIRQQYKVEIDAAVADPTVRATTRQELEKNAKGKAVTEKQVTDRITSTMVDARRTQQMYNDNSGAASTDKGHKASSPMAVSGMSNPTGEEVAAFVGNNNLSNIIDTEDDGSFAMDLFFGSEIRKDGTGLDNLFFFERGKNSDLNVQAIDKNGNVIGNLVKLMRGDQQDAGYSISTTEIGNAVQAVGTWGLSLAELDVASLSGIRVSGYGSSFNGADWKVVGRAGEFSSTAVPEPGTILALGVVGGLGFLQRRRKQGSLLK